MSAVLDFWLFGQGWTDVDVLGPLVVALGLLFIRELAVGLTEANVDTSDDATTERRSSSGNSGRSDSEQRDALRDRRAGHRLDSHRPIRT